MEIIIIRPASNPDYRAIVQKLNNYTATGKRKREQLERLVNAAKTALPKMDTVFMKYEKYRTLFAIGYTVFLTLLPVPALAAGNASGGIALIKLMQQASFWIGIGVVVWGIVEAQLDLPGWKSRILKGVLGYIAILLVPILFISLRDNLQVDVWQKLGGQ